MEALLDRLTPGQIVAVISILAGATIAISMIWAIAKYQLQALTEDAALRRERQKADLALRELLVERRTAAGEKLDLEELQALAPIAPEVEDLDAELARRFGALRASTETIERALRQALAAETANKKQILKVMDELLNYGARADAILAAVRPLCAPKERLCPAEHAV